MCLSRRELEVLQDRAGGTLATMPDIFVPLRLEELMVSRHDNKLEHTPCGSNSSIDRRRDLKCGPLKTL
jgi:hypothetical protein